jgi:hypothetical protein
METTFNQLKEFFLNFMMNDHNEGTLLHSELWIIEFHEGGSVSNENGEIILSGDNGRINLSQIK